MLPVSQNSIALHLDCKQVPAAVTMPSLSLSLARSLARMMNSNIVTRTWSETCCRIV